MPVTGPEVAEFFVEPTETMFAEFGRFVAVTMADPTMTSPAVILNAADGWLRDHWGYAQHPRNQHLTEAWAAVADDMTHGRERAAAAAARKDEDHVEG